VNAQAVVNRSHPGFPARLLELADAPATLYVRGQLCDAPKVLAIVGARAARGHSVALARQVASDLAARGVLILSGGAIGVDSAAHRGALDAGAATMAVLAGGLDTLYPGRNRPLFEDIVSGGGGLVSPYPLGTPPLRPYFVARNRVMAAMADAVLVIEAEFASGSLHTAEAARELGRPVLAAPGSPGCEALLARGAAVVETSDDAWAALDGAPRRPTVVLPERGSREALALGVLDLAAPLTDAAVAERTGLEPREAARALAGLELEGLALVMPGQAYLKSPLAGELLQS